MADKRHKQPVSADKEREAKSLRQRAKELLDKEPERLARIPPQDLQSLLHELRVHQIELEMQNQELREARQELERSQAEYASLYDHAPVGYLSLDRDGRIRRLNLSAADMLGKPRGQLLGHPLFRFIADEDRDTFLAEHRQATAEGGHHGCELRLQTPEEPPTWVHLEYQQTPLEESDPQVIRITLTDISERVRMEGQWRISREQLRASLQAAECGLWDWRVATDEAWWSPEFYRLLGYEEGDILPGYNTFISLLHRDDHDRVLKALDEHVNQGKPYDIEFRLRTRNRGYRWFRGHGRMLHNTRTDHHMAGLLQDVTAKHESETALAEARDRAEQANREKTHFLAAASHDLRQPLQSLSLYLNALRRMERPPATDEIINKMRHTLHFMGQMLSALLNISRLEAGNVTPNPVDFPVMDILRNVQVNLTPSTESLGLELRIHPSSLRISSDPVLLEEMIQNFVTNALRNTDRGGILLGCRRRGDKARIQVWDTGIGIPEEKLTELLTPTTENRQRRSYDDPIRPGLGLAIVRQTATLLGHTLEAASVPDRGSVFTIEVPLAESEETAAQTAVKTNLPAVERDRRPAVLVVDDDDAILDAYRTLAMTAGYDIACASSHQQALALLAEGLQPEVIICDLKLRRMPGLTVLKRLREELGRQVPAILLTGDTSTLDPEVQALPRCQVLYKPVEFEALIRTIEEMAI